MSLSTGLPALLATSLPSLSEYDNGRGDGDTLLRFIPVAEERGRADEVSIGPMDRVVLDQLSIAVIGLGYVGLPLAAEPGRQFNTLGFDIDAERIEALRRGQDRTREVSEAALRSAPKLGFSNDPAALEGCDVYIIAVPTPVDPANQPDLRPLRAASLTVGRAMRPGALVIYESTVYPGATEEVCGPILSQASGLLLDRDFHLGYSPERINPGDHQRRLTDIVKITSGSNPTAAELVDRIYASIIPAGTHRAPSIRVAEAAKVIENTQRDVNIALINELAMLFHRMDIDTDEVLVAAASKWNFLPFRPGLVGGHRRGAGTTGEQKQNCQWDTAERVRHGMHRRFLLPADGKLERSLAIQADPHNRLECLGAPFGSTHWGACWRSAETGFRLVSGLRAEQEQKQVRFETASLVKDRS